MGAGAAGAVFGQIAAQGQHILHAGGLHVGKHLADMVPGGLHAGQVAQRGHTGLRHRLRFLCYIRALTWLLPLLRPLF